MCIYQWLFEQNFGDVDLEYGARFSVGIALFNGLYYENPKTGKLYHTSKATSRALEYLGYESVHIDKFKGKQPLCKKHVRDIARLQLKLSYLADAKYDDHPASEPCPNQGFFA